MSKPNRLVEEEKQVFSYQSLRNESTEVELQNDTISKENQMVELCRNDLGGVDNKMNKPVEISKTISDVFSEGEDVSVRFGNKLENKGEGAHASGRCEHAGLNENTDVKVSSERANVSLEFDLMSENQRKCAYVSVDNIIDKPLQSNNVISDNVFSEGVDVSLRFEDGSQNPGEGAHVSGRCEQAVLNEYTGLKTATEKADLRLRFECMSENQGENAHVSVDNLVDKAGHIDNVISDVFSEQVDVSLKFEHILETQGEGSLESGRCDLVKLNELKAAPEGVDASLRFKHISENEGEAAPVRMKRVQPGLDNAKLEQNEESKVDKVDSSRMQGAQISMVEHVENLQSGMLKSCGTLKGIESGVIEPQAKPVEQFTPRPEMEEDKLLVIVLAIPADSCEKPRRGRKPKATLVKMESPQQLSVAGARALRSRSKVIHEDCEPSADLETRKGSTGRRGRKKREETDGITEDEFARMRKHLKYMLHRIKYAQNFLDAYSSEGWRGLSIEKLRPEKELQRAKADINRSKLKIRDLFQQLDCMSAEGKFPESLYDSDGLIDSEDIFCAKCGSKDLSPGNDILLCDGICERGFHQNCLNPPLPTEKIPPGDEGWLCPVCECKVDCCSVLNVSHGTKLTIEDRWEKVFPEAVATSSGNELDNVMGLPSDDSEDNEYNPDGGDEDAIVEGNESSSDESDSSDFSSASEDLGAICRAEQNHGLPSDDSEDDDDFDPNAVNVNEDGVELGSSGSDFTSASEDLGAAIGNKGISDQDEPPLPLEMEQNFNESSSITGKRCAERLDYKKLYDETFGNAPSDSSNDEEWTDMVSARKRKISTDKSNCASASADGTYSGTPRRRGRPPKANRQIANVSPAQLQESSQKIDYTDSGKPRRRGRPPKANCQVANGSPAQLQESSQKTDSTGSGRPRRRGRPPKANHQVANGSPAQLEESSQKTDSTGSGKRRPPYNKLGEAVTKVDKWFGNARWSLYHHPFRMEASINRVLSSSNTPYSVASNGGETAVTDDRSALLECGSADTSTKKLTPRRPREITEDDQSMLEESLAENSKEGILAAPLQTPEITQGTGQNKRRKSGA